MNKKLQKTRDEAHALYVKGFSQQKIAAKLQVSQATISRLIGKETKAAINNLARKSSEEYVETFTRAKLFFDDLLVQINEIETDKPMEKLALINSSAQLMEKALYLVSQNKFMQFVHYVNELSEEAQKLGLPEPSTKEKLPDYCK